MQLIIMFLNYLTGYNINYKLQIILNKKNIMHDINII